MKSLSIVIDIIFFCVVADSFIFFYTDTLIPPTRNRSTNHFSWIALRDAVIFLVLLRYFSNSIPLSFCVCAFLFVWMCVSNFMMLSFSFCCASNGFCTCHSSNSNNQNCWIWAHTRVTYFEMHVFISIVFIQVILWTVDEPNRTEPKQSKNGFLPLPYPYSVCMFFVLLTFPLYPPDARSNCVGTFNCRW